MGEASPLRQSWKAPQTREASREKETMSLALQLSGIRAAYNEARRAGDLVTIDGITAANMLPMLAALDRYERALSNFAGQKWADREMRETCKDFGIEPPPHIVVQGSEKRSNAFSATSTLESEKNDAAEG